MSVTIGLAVASVRHLEAVALFNAVLSQSQRPSYISIVFQGSPTDAEQLEQVVSAHALRAGYTDYSVVHDSGSGASRARNIALTHIPDSVDWVWTPNDTTRPEEGMMAELGRYLEQANDDVGIVATDYLVDGAFRRRVSDYSELTGWAVWHVLEGASIWRRRPLLAVGGFDERLGTGSRGWAQSGEGTDAIYRVRAAGFQVRTARVAALGQTQHLDPRPKFKRRKEFYYAVGLGCVIRRHYLTLRGVLAIVTPLVNWLLGKQLPGEHRTFVLAVIASVGRLIGVFLGDRACDIELRSEHWR